MFEVDGKQYYCDARTVFELWTEPENCFGCRYTLKDRRPRMPLRAVVKKVGEGKGEGKGAPRRKRSNAL